MIFWVRFSNSSLYHEPKYHGIVKEKEEIALTERLVLLQKQIGLVLGTLDEEIPNLTLGGYKI